jgi:hypothetical protein
VVHDDALAREQDVQPAITETPANGHQVPQSTRAAASQGRRLR